MEPSVAGDAVACELVLARRRRPGEAPGSTFRRIGLDVVADALEMRLREYGFGERPLADAELANAELAKAELAGVA